MVIQHWLSYDSVMYWLSYGLLTKRVMTASSQGFICGTERRVKYQMGEICAVNADAASITAKPGWRLQMEIFSTLMALYEGNTPLVGGFP